MYTQSLHAFVPPRTCTVEPDALLWQDDKGGSGRLTYADLTEVWMSYSPTCVQKNRYFLTLAIGHDTPVQISNENYQGLAADRLHPAGAGNGGADVHRHGAVQVAATAQGHRRIAP